MQYATREHVRHNKANGRVRVAPPAEPNPSSNLENPLPILLKARTTFQINTHFVGRIEPAAWMVFGFLGKVAYRKDLPRLAPLLREETSRPSLYAFFSSSQDDFYDVFVIFLCVFFRVFIPFAFCV